MLLGQDSCPIQGCTVDKLEIDYFKHPFVLIYFLDLVRWGKGLKEIPALFETEYF